MFMIAVNPEIINVYAEMDDHDDDPAADEKSYCLIPMNVKRRAMAPTPKLGQPR